MTKRTLVVVTALAACGGGKGGTTPSGGTMGRMAWVMVTGNQRQMDVASKFGALEVGADWKSYTKVNKAMFKSDTHGGRMVDTYVNNIGLEAFKKTEDMPVGSIVVKTSKDSDDGTDGPIFVMEKRAPGFNKDHGDWWYAIHWENPPDKWKAKLGGSIYWRTPSKK